jgi:Rho GTPase-activating protein 1
MRSALAHAAGAHRRAARQRSTSLSTVPPATTDDEYDAVLAAIAASILYRSPLPSKEGRPIYVLNAAAFPDAFETDYDSLLPYVLARLPGEDELLSGTEYEIIFFAGGQPEAATAEKKQGPGMGWYLQAYHVLNRAMRKRLQKLYIVHPRTWVRVLVGVFGTIVSPKFRRKIVHVNTLTQLALHIPIENVLIPPSVYLHDRKLSPDIYVPFVTGKRAFGVKHPFPKDITSRETRLPRVLRETTSFILMPPNIKTEGVFRIPPNATLNGALKEAYDRGQNFIVWKERGATVVQPGMDDALVQEVRLEDAYGVHSAASLIKQWYRDLREPIIPESSYDFINEKYGGSEGATKPEDLVDLILPESDASPLTHKSRRILTRHLIPMLSEVAKYESDNKMNSENLAICFSMCLVCGSNQMEDVKISSIVKKLLQVAIESWPQLREGMGISREKLFDDLKAPADARLYEDPLEEQKPPRQSQRTSGDDFAQKLDTNRITLEDAEEKSAPERNPTLPPRPMVETSPKKAPALPPRSSAPNSASSITPTSEPISAIPKRKPAPPILDPPRYSAVFDTDGNSINVADSPASYVPADGFGPPRHGPWSFDESEKKGFPPSTFPEPTDRHPALSDQKQRTVSGSDTNGSEAAAAAPTATSPRSASDGANLAKMAAQRAAINLAVQVSAANVSRSEATTVTSPDSNVVQSPESVLAEGDGVFRKPTWPASARPTGLAKPMLPPRQSQTLPIISSNNLAPANVPRPRAPSPGLLKRMSSIETGSTSEAASQRRESIEPKKLNLKKASVDDLRRLYEERVNTVKGLAGSLRKGSSSN